MGTALLEGVPVAGGEPLEARSGTVDQPVALVVLDKTKEVELQLKLRALQARSDEAQAQVRGHRELYALAAAGVLTPARAAHPHRSNFSRTCSPPQAATRTLKHNCDTCL